MMSVVVLALAACGSGHVACPNCSGCCNAGTCEDGTLGEACGQGGVNCTVCSGTNVCNTSSVGGGICGPSCEASCNGCCDGLACEPGTSNAACGFDGELCHACTNAQVCNAFTDIAGGSCE
jgi:hypothetical protein